MADVTKNKIDRVFEKVKEMGLTFGEHARKENLSDRTIKTYCDTVKMYENYLKTECGVKDISRAKPRHAYEYMEKQVEKYKNGEVSAFSMRKFAHAIHSFQEASSKTGVYQHKVKLGDKRVILGNLTEQGIFRKSEESQGLKANHRDYEKVREEIISSRSPNAKIVSEIHQIQRFLGARVHEAVKMKKEDITFHSDGSVSLRIKGKGGLVRHVSTKDQSTVKVLQERTHGKKDAAPVFQMPSRDGKDKNKTSVIETVTDVVRSAAVRAGVDRDGKKYTTHSGRKAYAQSQVNDYYQRTKKSLEKEVANRIKEDSSLKKKMDRTIKNIRDKMTDKNKAKSRELSHKELCLWLTSVDLGHGRLDVVRYYCDYPGDKKK